MTVPTTGQLWPRGNWGTPAAPAAPWSYENPLTSLTGLTSNGAGTWSVAGGLLSMAAPPTNTGCMIRTDYQISGTTEKHVLQVEARIPAGFTSTADVYTGIGFTNTAMGNGYRFAAARRANLEGQLAALLSVGVTWNSLCPRTWTNSQWHTFRLEWTPATTQFSMDVDGIGSTAGQYAQANAALHPAVGCFRNSTLATDFQYRNLKYWGGAAAATPPP